MSEAEIWESSLRHVVARVKGANEREGREHQRLWDAARFMAFYALIAPGNVKKGTLRSPRDLVEFAWDKANAPKWEPVPQLSASENAKLDAWINEHYPGALPADWKPPKARKNHKIQHSPPQTRKNGTAKAKTDALS